MSLEISIYISIIVIAILLMVIIHYWYIDFSKKRAQRKRFRRGAELENDARGFLESKGYRIVEEQAEYIHRFKANGSVEEVKLRPDYVVSKSGKTYLVEVKSGKSAIHIKNKNTRRQILEYDYAIENDGIFLLDMENKEMQLIEFMPKTRKSNLILLKIAIVIGIIGIFIPYWYIQLVFVALLIGLWVYSENRFG